MGTTLTNGIYLPNEGEKNCYAGLKTNWETLDQKIADIAALQQAVAGALHREIVASLPTTDIDPNTIYMILSGTSATENVYDEYMYVNNAWELIGTSATDLTNYYTKAEVDGKLLLKANASDLTSHTGDTTIHVTASDKSKWNTVALIKQLRLVNAQVGSATTIAFANIDDTNGIKVGDKCMDLDAKMFEITAVDTTNQTVTVGSALIDLALDANVVHTSGNETIGGEKTFTGALTASRNVANGEIILQNASYDPKTNGQGGVSTKSFSVNFVTALSDTFGAVSCYGVNDRTILRFTSRYFVDSQTVTEDSVEYNVYGDGSRSFKPRNNNNTMLGESTRKWKEVYANNYYYGANNVEFSTKFVTTDTAQTISGAKTFSSDITLQGTTTPVIKTISNIVQDSTGNNESISWIIRDKTDSNTVFAQSVNKFSGQSVDYRLDVTSILNGTSMTRGIRLVVDPANESNRFTSSGNNTLDLGSSTNKWKSVYAMNYYYGSNNVEFSTKFVTTDTNQYISGNKTFSGNVNVYNSDTSVDAKYLILRNQKVKRGSTTETGVQFITFQDKEGGTLVSYDTNVLGSGNTQAYINVSNLDANSQRVVGGVKIIKTPTETWFIPDDDNTVSSGLSNYKWKDVQTKLINGLTPSSLSMPDLNNGIDISSYITVVANANKESLYTPPANGWVCVRLSRTSGALGVLLIQGDLAISGKNIEVESGVTTADATIPVIGGVQVSINSALADGVVSAKFFPCQGNV